MSYGYAQIKELALERMRELHSGTSWEKIKQQVHTYLKKYWNTELDKKNLKDKVTWRALVSKGNA